MAAATEQTDVPPLVPPGVFVRDCAVLALGADVHGDDALAVWQFSARGKPTGAQVVLQDEAFTSADVALRLLSFLERRAITASDPTDVPDLLDGLTATANLDANQWWQEHLFSPVTAFAETCARRALYERTVTAAREAGRSTDLLEWRHDYSDCSPPRDFAALHELTRLRTPAGAPVVSTVLSVCDVLGWLVERWQETEQVKNRRKYLFGAHGGPETLPPSWLAAARHAETNRLPL